MRSDRHLASRVSTEDRITHLPWQMMTRLLHKVSFAGHQLDERSCRYGYIMKYNLLLEIHRSLTVLVLVLTMKAFATLAIIAGSIIPHVAAHYRFTALIINGQVTPDYQYVRPYTSHNSPVTDVRSSAFTCNTGSSPAPGTA
ncbi:hypothetical protein FRC03_004932, partial [Tulasnella sp. 419]